MQPKLKSDNKNNVALLSKVVALFLMAVEFVDKEMYKAFHQLEKNFDVLIKSGRVIGGSGFGNGQQRNNWRGKEELKVKSSVPSKVHESTRIV